MLENIDFSTGTIAVQALFALENIDFSTGTIAVQLLFIKEFEFSMPFPLILVKRLLKQLKAMFVFDTTSF